MTSGVSQALGNVEKAMDGFNQAIDAWITELRQSDDSAEADRMAKGAQAMRDSSGIFMAWAQHLANGMPEEKSEIGG